MLVSTFWLVLYIYIYILYILYMCVKNMYLHKSSKNIEYYKCPTNRPFGTFSKLEDKYKSNIKHIFFNLWRHKPKPQSPNLLRYPELVSRRFHPPLHRGLVLRLVGVELAALWLGCLLLDTGEQGGALLHGELQLILRRGWVRGQGSEVKGQI